MKSVQPQRQTALGIGASGDFGEALAHESARDSHDLILVPRSEAKLRALAGELAAKHGIQAAPRWSSRAWSAGAGS